MAGDETRQVRSSRLFIRRGEFLVDFKKYFPILQTAYSQRTSAKDIYKDRKARIQMSETDYPDGLGKDFCFYIRDNQAYYIDAWSKMACRHSGYSWNWAAFWFGWAWLGYRKNYIPALIILGVEILLYLKFNYGAALIIVSIVHFILGLFANRIYCLKCISVISRPELINLQDDARHLILSQKGGTSWLPVIVFSAIWIYITIQVGV